MRRNSGWARTILDLAPRQWVTGTRTEAAVSGKVSTTQFKE